jgi:septal ring factor EnvC (AmiA/AmiB activator)
MQSYQRLSPIIPPNNSVSRPALVVKLSVSSEKLKGVLGIPLAIAEVPSTPMMAPSSSTLTTVSPRTVHDSVVRHFSSTFRRNEELERGNAVLKTQLAEAQEQPAVLAQSQEQSKQEIARLHKQCRKLFNICDEQQHDLAQVNKLISKAEMMVQETVYMMTDTARQAQEIAQIMVETAQKTQDMASISNYDDSV